MPRNLYLLLVLCFCSVAMAAPTVEVKGLFKGSAVLIINGKQQLIKVGKSSPEGVKLIEATSKHALIEVEGKTQKLSLSRKIGGTYTPPEKAEVPPRERRKWSLLGQPVVLTGRSAYFMVDTGASAIAMSSREAKRLGIDYEAGRRAFVQTANGNAAAYGVMLSKVSVGLITLNNVEAMVVGGQFPGTNSTGQQFSASRGLLKVDEGVLVLTARY
ncbi:aspartyl protease family protein [Alteromonadaceae bacterium 2753L.S.0a.02]|nr:aspartyl protease family protein [Alteromonadaceae bacterium 2753L.S.0a.02]